MLYGRVDGSLKKEIEMAQNSAETFARSLGEARATATELLQLPGNDQDPMARYIIDLANRAIPPLDTIRRDLARILKVTDSSTQFEFEFTSTEDSDKTTVAEITITPS